MKPVWRNSRNVAKRSRNRRNRRLRKALARGSPENHPEISTISVNSPPVSTFSLNDTPITRNNNQQSTISSDTLTISLRDFPFSSPQHPELTGQVESHDFEGRLRLLEENLCDCVTIVTRSQLLDPEQGPLSENDLFYNWLISQYPLLTSPLPEGTFSIGPDSVDHETLFQILLNHSFDALIPCFLPNRQYPIGIPIRDCWKNLIRYTVRREQP